MLKQQNQFPFEIFIFSPKMNKMIVYLTTGHHVLSLCLNLRSTFFKREYGGIRQQQSERVDRTVCSNLQCLALLSTYI